MKKKSLFLALFIYLIAIMVGQETLPNILVIISDQHAGTILTQRGYEHIDTPGIDKLAQTGVMFNNAYCGFSGLSIIS